MAIGFGSISHTGARGTLTVTAPSSISEGDMLIAYSWGNESSISAPSGWTQLQASGSDKVFAKLAVLADESAANYSFGGSGDTGDSYVGVIVRFTGTFNSLISVQDSVLNASGLTTTGVDPDNGGAVVMAGAISGAATGAGVFSGYSVTTDNPSTWNELLDARYSDLAEFHYFVAWGLRPESTATGNSSVTESVGGTNTGGSLIALAEASSANGNQTNREELTLTVPQSGLSTGTTANQTNREELTLTANQSNSEIDEDKWTNQTKASPKDWTNQQKS